MANIIPRMAPRRRRGRRVARKRAKVGKSYLRPKRNFVKAVQAVIAARTEDKYTTMVIGQVPLGVGIGRNQGLGSGLSFSGVPGTPLAIHPLVFNTQVGGVIISYPKQILPPLSQSTSGGGRVGNMITAKNLSMKVQMSLNTEDLSGATSRNFHVRFLCLIDKNIRNNALLYPADNGAGQLIQNGTPVTTELFDVGNGVNIGTNGNPAELMWRINKKRYTVLHDRTFHLVKGAGFTQTKINQYIGTETMVSAAENHTATFKIKCPKTWKYDADSDLYPQGYAPFWCAYYNQFDGDGRPQWLAVADNAVLVNTLVNLDYEDS